MQLEYNILYSRPPVRITFPAAELELPRIRICSLPGSKIWDPDPLRSYVLLNFVQNVEHL